MLGRFPLEVQKLLSSAARLWMAEEVGTRRVRFCSDRVWPRSAAWGGGNVSCIVSLVLGPRSSLSLNGPHRPPITPPNPQPSSGPEGEPSKPRGRTLERNPGEDEAWRGNPGEGTLEREPWRGNPGEGTQERDPPPRGVRRLRAMRDGRSSKMTSTTECRSKETVGSTK